MALLLVRHSSMPGDWQIYITEDGSNYVLAVSKKLASLWIEGGFLPKRAILDYVNEKGDQICLFFSPTSLILSGSRPGTFLWLKPLCSLICRSHVAQQIIKSQG